MGQSRYIIGIDLGTTNSAAAYVDLADAAETPPIRLFKVAQLVDEARVEARPGLPSFLYLPGSHDLPAGATALPWDPERGYAVGTFARDQGARVPARLVVLGQVLALPRRRGSRERDPALGQPLGGAAPLAHRGLGALSCSHLREAWDHSMSKGRPEWRMGQSDVVLTVPASFDEVARELTVRGRAPGRACSG